MGKEIERKNVLTRRDFLGSATTAAVLGGIMHETLHPFYPMEALAQSVGRNRRPNIIVIMADDLGYGELGCYGQTKIRTPNIDRLAAEGLRFTQAYAGSTVCAPSRCSFVTGMHNGHNRIRDNLPHGIYLQPNDVTVAEVLKRAGYRTACIGKWGLGDAGSRGVPNCQGFDYFYGHLNQDHAHFYYPDSLWENDRVKLLQELVIVDEVGKLVGNRGGQKKFYTHDLFTEKSLKFIDRSRQSPFFLYLAYTIPHFSDYPEGTPEHFIVPSDEPYTNEDWSQLEKNYAAMITRLDGDVGKIMDWLKQHGIDGDTMVVFTSDNGPYGGAPVDFFQSNGKFRGLKRELYEGAIRVPFIARWPGVIEPNTISDHMMAFWDCLPTFAEMAGLEPPADVDGISFLPCLRGQRQRQHEYLFWDYGHVRQTYKVAVRTGPWKGIFDTKAPIELYHLDKDPGERSNIADKHAEVVQEMRELINKARIGTEVYPLRELNFGTSEEQLKNTG